ncbi:MAG: helix-turn-helix transcriptional regulator [Draconibacterium sp.]
MKERIKQYMDYKNISAGELAGTLEVQRSNISHVLNGRNKPGAAFIEKLLIMYPDLNARWLLTGEGNMIEGAGHATTIKEDIPEAKSSKVIMPDLSSKISNSRLIQNKNVEKVLLLLSDGTFIDYDKNI